jgi:uncharacterized protein (TIGR02996 family)
VSDEAALRAAICAKPDDDTARLVYADWLDENKQAKRAAFIRAKVAEHRLDHADTPAALVSDFIGFGTELGHDRVDWSAVDADVAAHRAAWKAVAGAPSPLSAKGEGVPRIRGVNVSGDERGFYSRAQVSDADNFLARAADLFRAVPITTVAFEALTADQARALIASGHLARLRELEFDEYAEPDALRALGAYRDAAGVRAIRLEEAITGDHIDALAEGKHWTGVREFEAGFVENSDDPPTADQFAALFARPWFRGVRKLDAPGCNLNAECARALARNCPELRDLDLWSNPLRAAGAVALAESKVLRHLRTLSAAVCEINDGGALAALMTTPNLPALAALYVSVNGARGPSAKELARGKRGPGLRALSASNLTPNAAEALGAHPAFAELWWLDVSSSPLQDEGVERLLRAAAFERLVGLDLSETFLNVPGVRALAAWPGGAALQWLNLSSNPFAENGARALIESQHLTNLKWVEATGRAAKLLSAHFKKARK